ncbi:MAG: VWA domain-containing protein [bacterium]
MENLGYNPEAGFENSKPQAEKVFHALRRDRDAEILSVFSPEEQDVIKKKQRILSTLAYFIGKDFQIPVELNNPGGGWHWDFEHNIIRIDPKDLLTKSMDHLRFIISHEGGHRRVSRTDFIPREIWDKPGFSFMMNAIEDPRDNNFVADSYPKFREQMRIAHIEFLDLEATAEEKAKKKLGKMPRFMKAGFEYMRLWFLESQGEPAEISPDLPAEVQEVVRETLASARDSWSRYPAREEADHGGEINGKPASGEDMIREYAKLSYEINRDEVWPEFKKLLEEDIKDQEAQEVFNGPQGGEGGGNNEGEAEGEGQGGEGGPGLPPELKKDLTPEELKTLEEAIDKAIKEGKAMEGTPGGKKGKPINLDSLPEALKEKIKKYIDSLPEDERKKLRGKAEAAIKEAEDDVNQELGGKLSKKPKSGAEPGEPSEGEGEEGEDSDEEGGATPDENDRTSRAVEGKGDVMDPIDENSMRAYVEMLNREVKKDANIYEKNRTELLPLINSLENELRQIFVDDTPTSWKGGHRSGKRIDMGQRIQEKARKTSVMESEAWKRRERPDEKEHAITLLIDLSGSMRENQRIEEAFKGVVVLTEVLNKIGLNVEVIGFNNKIHEYQKFGEPMSKAIREHIGDMFGEVDATRCSGCGNEHSQTDLGWAMETAAERLAKQPGSSHLLVVVSDGKAAESPDHPKQNYETSAVGEKINDDLGVKVVALGMGFGNGNLSANFTDCLIDVDVKEMAKQLAELIKGVI